MHFKRLIPTYQPGTYYNIMAVALHSIPTVTAYLVMGSLKGGSGLIAEGMKRRQRGDFGANAGITRAARNTQLAPGNIAMRFSFDSIKQRTIGEYQQNDNGQGAGTNHELAAQVPKELHQFTRPDNSSSLGGTILGGEIGGSATNKQKMEFLKINEVVGQASRGWVDATSYTALKRKLGVDRKLNEKWVKAVEASDKVARAVHSFSKAQKKAIWAKRSDEIGLQEKTAAFDVAIVYANILGPDSMEFDNQPITWQNEEYDWLSVVQNRRMHDLNMWLSHVDTTMELGQDVHEWFVGRRSRRKMRDERARRDLANNKRNPSPPEDRNARQAYDRWQARERDVRDREMRRRGITDPSELPDGATNDEVAKGLRRAYQTIMNSLTE